MVEHETPTIFTLSERKGITLNPSRKQKGRLPITNE
jgi:hypothetical protein